MHGSPDTRNAAFPGAAAALRAGVRLVAMNRPGYGRSDPDESGHASVADDTIEVADSLDIEQFSVLGMSLGGPYALPARRVTPTECVGWEPWRRPRSYPSSFPPLHRDDLTVEQAEFSAFSLAQVAASVRGALVTTEGYLRDAAVSFRDWEIRPERVSVPTRLWYGGLDANVAPRDGRWLADHIAQSTLVLRADSGHLGTLWDHWDDILTSLDPSR